MKECLNKKWWLGPPSGHEDTFHSAEKLRLLNPFGMRVTMTAEAEVTIMLCKKKSHRYEVLFLYSQLIKSYRNICCVYVLFSKEFS